MALSIVQKAMKGVMLLDLRGRITLGEETGAFREEVRKLLEAGHARIILDLREVNYIDSVGLSTLVATYASTRKQGGELKLLHLTSRVRDLLQITRLSTVFDVFDSLEQAQRSFERP